MVSHSLPASHTNFICRITYFTGQGCVLSPPISFWDESFLDEAAADKRTIKDTTNPPCPSPSPSPSHQSIRFKFISWHPAPLSSVPHPNPEILYSDFPVGKILLPFQQLTGTITLACNICWKSSLLEFTQHMRCISKPWILNLSECYFLRSQFPCLWVRLEKQLSKS